MGKRVKPFLILGCFAALCLLVERVIPFYFGLVLFVLLALVLSRVSSGVRPLGAGQDRTLRGRYLLFWGLGISFTLFVLADVFLPANTFEVGGHFVSLLPVEDWGFGTTSEPSYDPVTRKYGYLRFSRHGVYATIGFGGSRQPTPDEKADEKAKTP